MRNKLLITLPILFSFVISGCGAKSEPLIPEHTHHFYTSWTYDNDYHWHKCDGCDEINDKANHNFGIWVIDVEPTETTAGSKHRGCTICPYVQYASIDPTGGGGHEHSYPETWSYNSYTHWHALNISTFIRN